MALCDESIGQEASRCKWVQVIRGVDKCGRRGEQVIYALAVSVDRYRCRKSKTEGLGRPCEDRRVMADGFAEGGVWRGSASIWLIWEYGRA